MIPVDVLSLRPPSALAPPTLCLHPPTILRLTSYFLVSGLSIQPCGSLKWNRSSPAAELLCSKFDHIVPSLSPQYAGEVRDLIRLSPLSDQPYQALKEQLTKRTAQSEQRRLQQLFTGEELGGRKPSKLLRRMNKLLGDRPGLDSSCLRQLFLQRLPHNVSLVLASIPDGTSLEALADMADKIMEVALPSMAAIATPSSTTAASSPTSAADVEQLCSDLLWLEKLVKQLSSPRLSSHRSSCRLPTPTSPSTSDLSVLCWYHHKFGDRAQNCCSPCSWSSNEPAGHWQRQVLPAHLILVAFFTYGIVLATCISSWTQVLRSSLFPQNAWNAHTLIPLSPCKH